MVDPHRRRGLTITSRDADDLTLEVATSQLDLREDGDPSLTDGLHDRCLLGDTGALDDLGGS